MISWIVKSWCNVRTPFSKSIWMRQWWKNIYWIGKALRASLSLWFKLLQCIIGSIIFVFYLIDFIYVVDVVKSPKDQTDDWNRRKMIYKIWIKNLNEWMKCSTYTSERMQNCKRMKILFPLVREHLNWWNCLLPLVYQYLR